MTQPPTGRAGVALGPRLASRSSMRRPLLVLLLCLVVPGLASASEVCGRVVAEGEATFLETPAGRVRLAPGPATAQARRFPGREVVVEGRVADGVVTPERLVSPARATVQGCLVERPDWCIETEAGAEPLLNQAHSLLTTADPQPRVFDVWRFPQGLWLVGIEARTRQEWTLLRIQPKRLSLPSGHVRSHRTVWITAVDGDWVQLRFGQTEGWTPSETVDRLAPPPPHPDPNERQPRAGLTDLVPIPGDDDLVPIPGDDDLVPIPGGDD